MTAIGTWNMQGASFSTENKWNEGVRNLLTRNRLELICLQECGSVPASAGLLNPAFSGIPGLELYRWGTLRSHVFIVFLQTDPNGNRCNIAIVSRAPPTAGLLVYPAGPPMWRPAVGAAINGAVFFSLHAISPNGPDVGGLLAGIAAAVGGPPAGPWAALGDYNREPNTVPGGHNVCPPNANTCSTQRPVSRFDYLIVRGDIAPVTGAVQGLLMSDHYPVQFVLDVDAAVHDQIDGLHSRSDAAEQRASGSESRADKADLVADLSGTPVDAAQGRLDTEQVRSTDDRPRIADAEGRLDVHGEIIAELQAEGLIDSEDGAQLDVALQTARTIGTAIGILMSQHCVNQVGAFELLKKASQDSNRKLRLVAEEVVLTSDLLKPPPPS